jgi:PAS domain-containing protein
MFENMLNGLAYCRMIYDDKNQPEDFIYLETNSAFEKLTGLKDVVGKKITDIIPGFKQSDPDIIQIYGRVASTGKSELFETYVKALDMWFSASVYSPQKEYFVAIFDVITERKKREGDLKNKFDELAQLNSLMVGREVKMTELKAEIEELKLKLQNQKT